MSDQSPTSPAPDLASRGDAPDFSSPGRSSDPRRRQPVDAGGGRGTLSIADGVVAKIAGIACREVSGVHNMGTGASRLFGAVKEHLPGTSATPDAAQGVGVEVGDIETAIDLDVVTDYGAAIPDVARAIRENVIRRVESMTGLSVTEVNVSVDDVYLGDELAEPHEEPRVQ
jgi:uncharacterized alkaline shock family protein YloU